MISKLKILITNILAILGLSSIVDDIFGGVLAWQGFLRDLLLVYETFRNQIIDWIFGWWAWFSVPTVLIDCLIIWFCISTSLAAWTKDNAAKAESAANIDALSFALAPLTLLHFTYIALFVKGPHEIRIPKQEGIERDISFNIEREEVKDMAVGLWVFVGRVFCIVLVLLFINWQLFTRQ